MLTRSRCRESRGRPRGFVVFQAVAILRCVLTWGAGPDDSSKQEINASWALFISIMLLIVAFFTSYTMQQRKITAIHETVVSIFAG